MTQLALPLKLADHAVFASFLAAGNETLFATLQEIARGDSNHGCWLWGAPSSGKTHLLQAICEAAGDRAVFVPLQTLFESGPGVLDGLANRALVCVDDLDQVSGDRAWEAALFELCNQVFDTSGQLIVTSHATPRESGIELPDLVSRLTRLPVFRLFDLDDTQRIKALQLRSKQRGLSLHDDAARYVMNRSRRDMSSLFRLLDRLDTEALRAKRRLTIPFIRDVLNRTDDESTEVRHTSAD
jgi:DnaA family protein